MTPTAETSNIPPPILVVDDDPTQRFMFRQVLERDGYQVIEAENGLTALALFTQHKPLLALVDAVMPEMDGFELCHQLHALEGGGDLTVLIATSLSDDADINRAFQAGAADFIGKPINWTVLRGRVSHLLQGKMAEQRMRETERQMRQEQKMNAIGNLSSGIAHEFNNILASVMGYTELLMEFLSRGEETKPLQYATEVYYSAERARNLIQQMQQFSQSKPGELQRLEPLPLLKESVRMIRSCLPSSIDLQIQAGDGLSEIMADPMLFQQLLTNLLINARDATNGTGRIEIEMRQVQLGDTHCNSCHNPFSGEFLQLQVRDNGHGITPEVAEKMFEPYYTTKPVGRGTGMGLSVVHGIMHDLQGHIVVKSRPNEGANFSLLFPINHHSQTEENPMGQSVHITSQSANGRKILLVDDEISITGYLSELLEMHDYEVTVCNDSLHALSLFVDDPLAFDLVITDMTLPGMTGIEMAAGMLQARPELPVILCSGYIDEDTRQTISTTGIKATFNKPVDSRELIESVGKLLRAA